MLKTFASIYLKLIFSVIPTREWKSKRNFLLLLEKVEILWYKYMFHHFITST